LLLSAGGRYEVYAHALGSEFGGRHERNYAGNAEDTRRMVVSSALASGEGKRFTGLAEQCMAEYGLDGRTIPGFIDPDDISLRGKC
jgi:4-hydroxyphenylacetate 3-monooxygenase